MNILAICTGNICRSPMAAGFLRAGAPAVGLDANVASAGTIPGGRPADPHAVAAMADRGIDISRHRSHEMAPVDVKASDLVLAMAREHVIAAAAQVPDAFSRTFTIRSFVARARIVGPCPSPAELPSWLELLGEGRTHAELLRHDADDDIADPLGQGRRAFDRTAGELEGLCWAALDLIGGYPPRS